MALDEDHDAEEGVEPRQKLTAPASTERSHPGVTGEGPCEHCKEALPQREDDDDHRQMERVIGAEQWNPDREVVTAERERDGEGRYCTSYVRFRRRVESRLPASPPQPERGDGQQTYSSKWHDGERSTDDGGGQD